MKMKLRVGCILTMAFFIVACNGNSIKETDLPSIVLNTYKSKFNGASDAEWQKVNNMYEVEFELNGFDHAAQIDESGNIKMTKKEIKSNELPPAISANIIQQYKNYKIDEVEKIEQNMNTFFQLELDGKKDKQIVFTADGKKTTSVPYWD